MSFKYNNQDKVILEKFFSPYTCSSQGFATTLRSLITVDSTSTVDEVLKKLIENRILSVPIVKNGKVVAVVSILDLVAHTLDHFAKSDLDRMTKHTFNFFVLVSEKKMVASESITSLEEIGQTDPIVALNKNSPLIEAIKLMGTKDLHRVLILGDKGEPTSLITQSKIIQLLTLIMDCLTITSVPIFELGIIHKNVITVLDTDMARDAFQKMKTNHISGVAVVNKQGTLIGNISASDIKLLGHSLEWFDTLGDTCITYLQTIKRMQDKLPIRSSAFHLGSPGSTNLALKCHSNNSLGVIIKLVLFYEVHRVYVVDNDNKPIGVISLGDIIKTIFNI